MYLQKYNFKRHMYESVLFEDNKYNFKTYSNNMDEIVHCPHCLKPVRYGDCYTSLQFHTPITGFGYAVCEDCYEKEYKERLLCEETDK